METELAAILLTLAFLLLLVSMVQPLARKIRIPDTVLIALLGIGLGSAAAAVTSSLGLDLFEGPAEALMSFPINSEGFLFIFLPLLVFQGALDIDVRSLAHETGTVLGLAIVAVVVSTATIGLALYPCAGQPLAVCLLLGAIVATTDPSAVAGIFREIGAASRLSRLVEGEALLNDAAAIAIFTILLAAITAHHQVQLGDAVLDFAEEFAGAMIVGFSAARLFLWMASALGGFPAAQISLTVVLPYCVYILCDEVFGFSGVVATAAAGLTVSAYGSSTFRPQVWRFLHQMWHQMVFWAGSLVFILAALMVPRLLMGMTRWDVVLILIASGAGLAARALVVFGFLPLLSAARLTPPVPGRFRVTMVWGGLRGAITLALALAVTENPHVDGDVAHFIGIIATGFVLVTLLVNGTTLRTLVIWLKLDKLSPIDEAMRNQIIAIGLGTVAVKVSALSDELGFSARTRAGVVGQIERRIARERAANRFEAALTERNRVTVALITIANQERSLLLDLFKVHGLSSRRVMEVLLRTAEAMVDGARLEGRHGYAKARKKRLRPTLRFRLAVALHEQFNIDRPLMFCMMERFEMLIITHLVSTSLMRFVRQRMEPTLGKRMTEIVFELLHRQRRLIDDALQVLRFHYAGYADALESRILRQIALHQEEEEYALLERENLISAELHRELRRWIETMRHRLAEPLRFNLRSGIEQRLRTFLAFNGIPDSAIQEMAHRVSICFLSPGEHLFRAKQKVHTVYALVSGTVEGELDGKRFSYQAGDLVGACSLLEGEPMSATVRSSQFAHLLAIPGPLFRILVMRYPIIARQVLKMIHQKGLAENFTLTAGPESPQQALAGAQKAA
ncbi:cation:proton antiporter domain-containing protein [Formicincola oecophyllae]|nr:cation:proton antiporter [Formicincola oecophyllae]